VSEPTTAEFHHYAAEARLTPEQLRAAELWIAGNSYDRIGALLGRNRREVYWLLRGATEALAKVAPDFWKPGRDFPRHLVRAVANKADHRDGNLTGVAPAYDVRDKLPKAEVFTADREEIRQSKEWCLRHWARELVGATG